MNQFSISLDFPDERQRQQVQVSEEPNRGGTFFEVHVARPDLGKVIGRQGRTARALRPEGDGELWLEYRAGGKRHQVCASDYLSGNGAVE